MISLQDTLLMLLYLNISMGQMRNLAQQTVLPFNESSVLLCNVIISIMNMLSDINMLSDAKYYGISTVGFLQGLLMVQADV